MRIATWNVAGAFPRAPEEVLWDWIENIIDPDVIVLTEAKVPKNGFPDGWQSVYIDGGIGSRRRWGTIVAARGMSIEPSEFKRRKSKREENAPHPAASFTVEIAKGGRDRFQLVAHYGLMLDEMNGLDSLDQVLNELEDVQRHHGEKRTIIAGDFNLWPDYTDGDLESLGMTSATSLRTEFPALQDPMHGSRIWTHKNGRPNGYGKVQELDHIFISGDLVKKFAGTVGGVDDFPGVWPISDHAPVVVDLDV